MFVNGFLSESSRVAYICPNKPHYLEHAIEGRRRVKEQMNKRKPDEEFANIDLSYFNAAGVEVVVYCPESHQAAATQQPQRQTLSGDGQKAEEKKKTAPDEPESLRQELPPLDLKGLIAGHENERVEFKSTLQWDMKQEQRATWLRDEVVKTICAFLNSSGGTLLIGVSDEGEVLGLQPDFKIMNGKTLEKQKDNFALLINNLINDQLGVLFSRDVTLSFEEIDGETIAIIRVRPGPEPAFVNKDEFYVRSGNQSRSLEMADTIRYIERHW